MSSSSMEKYDYVPLDESKGEQTRLLRLKAGPNDQDITAVLQPVSLQDPELPPFTAISYTWGNSRKEASIKLESAEFGLTTNLLAALRRLRKPHEDVWIWADAICINQEDTADKNLQVPQMHLVYQAAQSCVVWLGPGADNSDLGIRKLQGLRPGQFDTDDLEQPEWDAVVEILERPYWERIWILQELAWAKDFSKISVACGELNVDLTQLLTLQKDALRPTHKLGRGLALYTLALVQKHRDRALTDVRAISAPSPHNELIPDTISSHIGMKATDPRDHIYAILNLIPKSSWPAKPDYSRDVIEVFAELVIHFMSTQLSLEILRLCLISNLTVDLPPHIRSCKSRDAYFESHGRFWAALPSWIPNWSSLGSLPAPRTFGEYALLSRSVYRCGTELEPYYIFTGDRNYPKFTTHGILYDKIERFFAFDKSKGFLDAEVFEDLKHEVFSDYAETKAYLRGGMSCDEAFWRTLMLDRNDSGSRASFNDVAAFVSRNQSGSELDSSPYDYAYLYDRHLFTTKKGLIGFGSADTRNGDLVAIIPGCSTPILLRQSEARSSYHIVGESYVHGIMDGEIKDEVDSEDVEVIQLRII